MSEPLSMSDAYGRRIHFGGDPATGAVTVNFTDRMTSVLVSLSGDRKDDFARLWMEACRRADGEAPAAGAREHGAEARDWPRTPRGFAIYARIDDASGNSVRIQQSSLATERCVWLFCQDAIGNATAPQLTVEQARQARDALDAFIADQGGTNA